MIQNEIPVIVKEAPLWNEQQVAGKRLFGNGMLDNEGLPCRPHAECSETDGTGDEVDELASQGHEPDDEPAGKQLAPKLSKWTHPLPRLRSKTNKKVLTFKLPGEDEFDSDPFDNLYAPKMGSPVPRRSAKDTAKATIGEKATAAPARKNGKRKVAYTSSSDDDDRPLAPSRPDVCSKVPKPSKGTTAHRRKKNHAEGTVSMISIPAASGSKAISPPQIPETSLEIIDISSSEGSKRRNNRQAAETDKSAVTQQRPRPKPAYKGAKEAGRQSHSSNRSQSPDRLGSTILQDDGPSLQPARETQAPVLKEDSSTVTPRSEVADVAALPTQIPTPSTVRDGDRISPPSYSPSQAELPDAEPTQDTAIYPLAPPIGPATTPVPQPEPAEDATMFSVACAAEHPQAPLVHLSAAENPNPQTGGLPMLLSHADVPDTTSSGPAPPAENESPAESLPPVVYTAPDETRPSSASSTLATHSPTTQKSPAIVAGHELITPEARVIQGHQVSSENQTQAPSSGPLHGQLQFSPQIQMQGLHSQMYPPPSSTQSRSNATCWHWHVRPNSITACSNDVAPSGPINASARPDIIYPTWADDACTHTDADATANDLAARPDDAYNCADVSPNGGGPVRSGGRDDELQPTPSSPRVPSSICAECPGVYVSTDYDSRRGR